MRNRHSMPTSPKTKSWRSPRGQAAGPKTGGLTPAAARCRRKFLRFFPDGYADETYIDWERDYKWVAHERWMEQLDRSTFRSMLDQERYSEIAQRAVSIESRTNLLFSFEKMALRDAVKPANGARAFATGLTCRGCAKCHTCHRTGGP